MHAAQKLNMCSQIEDSCASAKMQTCNDDHNRNHQLDQMQPGCRLQMKIPKNKKNGEVGNRKLKIPKSKKKQ